MLGLVVGVQLYKMYIYYLGGPFPQIGYYIVSRRFPCAIQEVILDYLLDIH